VWPLMGGKEVKKKKPGGGRAHLRGALQKGSKGVSGSDPRARAPQKRPHDHPTNSVGKKRKKKKQNRKGGGKKREGAGS